MNVVWSQYIQGVNTLYFSRKLRFDDLFAAQYTTFFQFDAGKNLKFLEIGCGPGALAGALHRWYPNAGITAIDRDSEFIRFAAQQESGITFMEGDATNLPFDGHTFDVTISNTVSEHIEPSKFYAEQLRVLKPGGVCLVLSSRKGIQIAPACTAPGEYEQKFWEKAAQYDDAMEKYAVCKYPMSEAELPAAMEQAGFHQVTTGFATIDLTPDNPKYPASMAHDMINANRYNDLDAVEARLHIAPDHFDRQEIEAMKRLINAKYDERIHQYDCGIKCWDTSVSIIMMIRGVK